MAENLQDLAHRVQNRLDFIRSLASGSKTLQRKKLEGLINDQEKLIHTILESSGESPAIKMGKIDLLIQAVRSIAEGRNLKEILQGALSGAALLVGAHSGAVVFTEEFENASYPSIKFPWETTEKYLYSRTVVQKVIETGEGVYEKDISQREGYIRAGSIIHGGIISVLAAPIKSFGEIIGVVYLDSRESDRDLDKDDLPFLCDFASIASLAYETTSLAERRIQFLEKDNHSAYTVMIGSSHGLKHIDELITRYAPHNQPVLITGETGSGKKIVAQELHNRSHVPGPFVVVNCAGIPESLFEAEFFGHVKGAFTDAIKDRKGLIEQAQDGTLFLDEIGELSMGTQAKLLQFLDDGTYRMIGDSEEKKSEVRIIAATNRNLPEFIDEKQFREDLYYRLNVLTIEIPPLRARVEDIPELCEFFVKRECQNLNKPVMKIESDVINSLRTMPWKGNVRELKNIVQRLVIHTDGPSINIDSMHKIVLPGRSEVDPFNPLMGFTEEEVTSNLRKRALELEGGNVAAAARRLGITPPTLHKWLKKSGNMDK